MRLAKPTQALTKGYDGKSVANILKRGSEKRGFPQGKEATCRSDLPLTALVQRDYVSVVCWNECDI